MNWTRELPAQSGWFWWRRLERLCAYRPVFVADGRNGLAVLNQCGGGDIPLAMLGGEWQGPLRPDESAVVTPDHLG